MNSIRRQLTGRLLCGWSALWLAGGAVVYWIVRAELTHEFDQTLRATAQSLVALTDVNEEGELELDLTSDAPEHFQIWLPDHTTWRRSGPSDLPPRTGLWDFTLPDGSRGRALGFRFVPRQETQTNAAPELALVVARPRRELDHLLHLVGAALLGGAVLLSLGAGLLVALTVRRGLLPLEAVAERAARIDAQSLATRFPTTELPRELRPICERLNDLLARLEQSFARERRFSADVAHELRTPVAELRTLAEVALQWPDEPAPIQEALEIAKQMETMITRLLALARCEDGAQSVAHEPVALRPLLEGLSGSRVRLDVSADCVVQTDRTLLTAVLSNLIGNALEYASPDGAIEVRFATGTLTVSNTTDDLSEEDVAHMFERFWRKDAARSGSEHAGLGLALARGYAQALGLRLSAELVAGRTLRMNLSGLA